MKAQAAFVRADRVVELHAERAVHLYIAAIVDPRDAKHDDAIRLGEPFEDARLLILRMIAHERHQRVDDFANGLMKLGLVRILRDETRHERIDVRGGLSGIGRGHEYLRGRRPEVRVS